MSTNPYESPQSQAEPRLTPNEARWIARRSVRVALLILLAPALYNFICFNFTPNANRPERSIYAVYRTLNSLGFVLTVAGVWFFGLTVFEFVTGGFHSIYARNSRLEDWKETLYTILRRIPFFAVPGAVLWAIWVMAIYQLQLGFYFVSIPIGIAAHLLAACVYVPLFYRWYKLERANAPASPSNTLE